MDKKPTKQEMEQWFKVSRRKVSPRHITTVLVLYAERVTSVCPQRWWIVITLGAEEAARRAASSAKSRNQHATDRSVSFLATGMPKPTRIVISCDPRCGKKAEFCTSAPFNGSHVALLQTFAISAKLLVQLFPSFALFTVFTARRYH